MSPDVVKPYSTASFQESLQGSFQSLHRRRRRTESTVYDPAIDRPHPAPSWTHWTASPSSPSTTALQFHLPSRRSMISLPREPESREALSLAGVTMAGDPRDTLGPSSAADLPDSGGTTTTTPPLSTRRPTAITTEDDSSAIASHPRRSDLALSSLPQSRFNFEYPLPDQSSTYHSSGPDPAPAQRSLYDKPRRSVPSFTRFNLDPYPASLTQPPSPVAASAIERHSSPALPLDADSADALSPNASKRRKQSAHIAQQSRVSSRRRMPSSTVSYVQGRANGDRAVNGFNHEDITGRTDDTTKSKEDVFLNIARSDSGRRDSFGQSNLRRSRFGLSGNSLRSPTSSRFMEPTPSPDQPRFNNPETPLHSNNGSPSVLPYSASRTYSVSAHPLDDSRRHSAAGPSSRSTIGFTRSRLNPTSPDASPLSDNNVERRASLQDARLHRHSTLSTIRSSRQPSGSEATERPRVDEKARQDGTESTLSTNAPSTVWDELEDLKSRIKKLELTGKLPPSSQAAISSVSGERPRTATTTVTTLSSSPKNGRKATIPAPAPEPDTAAVLSQVHPLLQSALIKAKSALSNDVYKALEATVNDALSLSTILGSANAPSSSMSMANGYSPGYNSSDRQSRRKADSVCRGLTELCLALIDDRPQQQPQPQPQPQQQPQENYTAATQQSPEAPAPTPIAPIRRSATLQPELNRRQSISRATSRLESRRSSLANIAVRNSEPPPPLPDIKTQSNLAQPSQVPPSPAAPPRLTRLSSLRRKPQEEEANDTPHKRTISRAMTEIGTPTASRLPPRQRASHGYTGSQSFSQRDPPSSSHGFTGSQSFSNTQRESFSQRDPPPTPSQQVPRTPTLQTSGIPLRRSFMSPVTPATTRSNIQAGSRRYGLNSSFSSTADRTSTSNGDVTATPQGSSQTRITAPSSKLAASYTPISQNRLRANSLGTRRFGLRQRQMTSPDALDDSID